MCWALTACRIITYGGVVTWTVHMDLCHQTSSGLVTLSCSQYNTFSFSSMLLLPLTLFFLSCYTAVEAGTIEKDGPCSQGDNRLQAGTFQFWSECDSQTYCAANSTCVSKGCRRDDFPFGYPQDSDKIPDKCQRGEFCPDEQDACQPLLPVDSPCQLNRDGDYLCLSSTPSYQIFSA